MPSQNRFVCRVMIALGVATAALLLPQPAPAQFGAPGASADSKPAAQLPEDPAAVIAVVGQSPILLADIAAKVDSRINQVLKEIKQEFPKDELARARTQLARGALAQTIQTKMMSVSFMLDQVGTENAEKRQEVTDMMMSRARQLFFENELQGLKEKYDTEDLAVLDAKLRETGTSLLARQRDFTDQMLGHMYMKSKIDQDPNVTLAEITAAYNQSIDEYRHGAKARWEQLSVLFSNYPSREAAMTAIAAMGRDSFYGGNLRAVAREKSEEPYADEGGVHDWTTQGSLASKPLDEQIFSIPLDRMSEIIEDDQGLHIVRVLDRMEAGVKPLAELQDEIREQLKKQKISKSQVAMFKEMRKRVPVWSIFPEDVPGAQSLESGTATASRPTDSPSVRR